MGVWTVSNASQIFPPPAIVYLLRLNVRRGRKKYHLTTQRIATGVWTAILTAVLVAVVNPVSTGIVRLFIAVAVPLLWVSAIFLLRRRKAVAIGSALSGLIVIGFAVLPGRPTDPTQLRRAYMDELRHYEGSPFVLGGENRRGIDCSGLVRRALINAHVWLAFATLNPKAIRTGLDLCGTNVQR